MVLTPLPSQRSSCHGLPPTPKVHVSVRPPPCSPTARRPVLPYQPLASPRWEPASPRSSMAAPCGSMLLSPGFTLAPGVGGGREEAGAGNPRLGPGLLTDL